jgi:LmbE family N-acetylglucosaminyl deacetylase
MDARALARRGFVAIERAGREEWRHRTIRRGVDVTSVTTTVPCLVLAPHPDDETLGCGATIARKRAAGTPVRVIVAADGRSSHRSSVIGPDDLAARRAGEVVDACGVLGIDPDDVVQLGFEDESLDRRGGALADAIAAELDAFDYGEVRLPSGRDWHPDHRALRAALDRALSGRSTRPRVLEHPVWLWVHGPWDSDPNGPWARRRPVSLFRGYVDRRHWPTAELVRTEGFLGRKRRALLAHRSQTTNLTGEPGWEIFDEAFLADFLLPVEIAFAVEEGDGGGGHDAGPSAAARSSVT